MALFLRVVAIAAFIAMLVAGLLVLLGNGSHLRDYVAAIGIAGGVAGIIITVLLGGWAVGPNRTV